MAELEVEIAIIDAGIAAIASVAAAHYLSESGAQDILIVDKLQPLSLTTACSGENFRNN